jgi:opacity protein-like surface antigen
MKKISYALLSTAFLTTSAAMATDVTSMPALSPSYNFSGVYTGLTLGHTSGGLNVKFDGRKSDLVLKGVNGGVFAGYGKVMGAFYVGGEVSYTRSGEKANEILNVSYATLEAAKAEVTRTGAASAAAEASPEVVAARTTAVAASERVQQAGERRDEAQERLETATAAAVDAAAVDAAAVDAAAAAAAAEDVDTADAGLVTARQELAEAQGHQETANQALTTATALITAAATAQATVTALATPQKLSIKKTDSIEAVARLGVVVNQTTLPYLKVGVVSSQFKSGNVSKRLSGLVVGAGVDFKVSPKVMMGLGYSYATYKKLETKLAGLPVEVKPVSHNVMVRVAYHF